MLSAFKTQNIYELKSRDKSKIESLLAYGDRLLVGLNTGSLRVFRVNEASQPDVPVEDGEQEPASPTKQKAVDLLRDEEKFSKRPIQQLAIVKEANLLVSLSDGYVSLHDLQSYQPVERLEKTKGATCFAVSSNVVKDTETGVPSLVSRLAVAVAVKRKVLCWTWQDMEQLPDAVELSLEAVVKSLTWATGTKLVAGMDPGFVVVDIETQETTYVNKPASRATESTTAELAGARFGAVSSSGMGYIGMGSWVPKPMATGITEGQILLARDVNTLFADYDGTALEKRQVPWALAPEAIGYSYPYLLALQPPEKGTLQIRNPDSLSLLQTIAVPNAVILHVPQPNISLAHAGKGFLVASDRVIWRMNALPYDSQLQELVEKEKFDEAISLLNLLEDTLIEDKAERIREMMTLKAMILFEDQKYQQALDLFTDAEAPPERVIKLYPPKIAGDLPNESDDTLQKDAENAVEDAEGKTDDAVKEAPSTPSKSLLGKLTGGHSRKESDTASIKTPNRTETNTSTPRKSRVSRSSADGKALVGDDLKIATRCLLSFLAQIRQRIKKYLDTDGTLKEDPPSFDSETGKPAFGNLFSASVFHTDDKSAIDWQGELLKVAQLVDTTLFRSYMFANPSLAGSLFRIDNFCDPEVVQHALYESHRYNDLIDFLHGKKLHRQALEMLTKFGKGEAEGEIPEGMQGPDRVVAYLKQLPPDLIEMILEFAAWPVQEKPEVGIEVFTADTENAEHLPKEKVLQFLADINVDLELQYLEHIINELGNQTPEFHQRLVDLYLDELKRPYVDDTRRSVLQEKLETFLRNSKRYNKNKTFKQLPSDDPPFYEARAIVLSAMGQHKQALSIYVFQIKDYEKAEQYCNNTYLLESQEGTGPVNGAPIAEKPALRRSTTEVSKDQPNIFATLLGLYLRPPQSEEKRWPQALELLGRHGSRLPASSTLDLMPDDLAVAELQDYFRGRIRHATSLLRQEKVVRSLEGVRKVNAERLLQLGTDKDIEMGRKAGRNRRARIDEDAHCKVCHRRFGASAVRVYPDGEVVHYGCVNKRAQDGSGAQRSWN